MSETAVPAAGGLNVVVTNPYAWPHVRRGAERLLHDLSTYLHAAGHNVTVVAMAPEPAEEIRDGIRYLLLREQCATRLRQLNSLHFFAWRLQRVLREVRPDVVFCLNYFDAYAAVRCRARDGLTFRVIFQNVGIPVRRYFRAVPIDRWFMRSVLNEADDCLVLSRFAQERLREEFGKQSQLLPPPVNVQDFAVAGPGPSAGPPSPREAEAPVVLFVGDVNEPRKGARVLSLAFARLRASMPTLRLRFVGAASDETRRSLLEHPDVHPFRHAIEFCGVGDVAMLPAHYRAASVTVLPAIWEAFGLVLVESLASGTPVVGARHGGISDIVEGNLVGRLFEPGTVVGQSNADAALADALRAVLERGKTSDVASACQARARQFSWRALGPAYLSLIRPRDAIGLPRFA